VIVNGARHPGIYITTEPTTDLGRSMKLSPGMVLLTIDGYSMIGSGVADGWIAHRGAKLLPFTYALAAGGKPAIYSGQVQPETSGPSNLSIMGPQPSSRGLTGTDGPVHPKLVPQMTDGELSNYCISLINDSRKSGGLSPLQEDTALANFAHQYADYMAKNRDEFEVSSSRNPHQDLNGRGPQERARQAGLNTFINENIGRSSRSLGDVVQVTNLHRQMMSGTDGHREAIMNPEARTVGIGIARGDNRLYLTEEFGH